MADQHGATRGTVGHQAGIASRDAVRARARNVHRDHEEDASARHPRLDWRRLRLCLDAAGHQRQGHPDLRRNARLHADGSHPGRHQIRRRDHGHGQRTRPRSRRLLGGSSAGRWRPDCRRAHSAGPQTHPRHYEGWQVPQSAADESAASAADGMSLVERSGPVFTGRQAWTLVWVLAAALVAWLFIAVWPTWLDAVLISKKAFINSLFNGVTLAGLYFLVASGFTLVFGLMRNVNLAHGSLYLLGAYVGYDVSNWTNNWFLGVVAGTLALGVIGALLQVLVFQRLAGDELRQTLVTIGISIVAADLMLAVWGGKTYQFTIPEWLDGAVATPIITAIKSNGQIVTMRYPFYRLVVLAAAIVIGVGLWLALNKTKIGMMIRAGVDDRAMLSASGVNTRLLFVGVFAIGGMLAGFSGVVGGSALSIAPGEDVRYLLASLVVVIVGGMGSITGAAIGALLVGLAEQIGLVYLPTYGIVLTFIIMVVTLALRPQGIMGTARIAA